MNSPSLDSVKVADELLRAVEQIEKPGLARIHELLAHTYCAQHRDGYVSGHAAADCPGCDLHHRARDAWREHQHNIMMAIVISADEFDNSGCIGDDALMRIVADIARTLGIEVEL